MPTDTERLDWWASHSMDHCVSIRRPDLVADTITVLDDDNIRASIDEAMQAERDAKGDG